LQFAVWILAQIIGDSLTTNNGPKVSVQKYRRPDAEVRPSVAT